MLAARKCILEICNTGTANQLRKGSAFACLSPCFMCKKTVTYKKNNVNYLIMKGRLVLLTGTSKRECLKYFPSFDIPQAFHGQNTVHNSPQKHPFFLFFYPFDFGAI